MRSSSRCTRLFMSKLSAVAQARLRIVPLSGAANDLEFTQSECSGLISSASIALETLNKKIRGMLRRKSLISLLRRLRPVVFVHLDPHARRIEQNPRKGRRKWPPDVFGRIWDINILQNGRMNLRIAADGGEQVTLLALSSQQHPALENIQRGHQVGMFNARPSADRLEYSVGPMTILYKYEDSFCGRERLGRSRRGDDESIPLQQTSPHSASRQKRIGSAGLLHEIHSPQKKDKNQVGRDIFPRGVHQLVPQEAGPVRIKSGRAGRQCRMSARYRAISRA